METKNPNPPAGGEEQPLELLKREDVRTLAKDLAQTRNQEALGERAKIGNIPQENKPAQQPVPAPAAPSQAQRPEAPTAPERPVVFSMPESETAKKPRFGKLFIRVVLLLVILFFIANAIALAFFLFSQKENAPSEDAPQETISQPQPLIIPAPAFPIVKEEQVELERNGNVVETLSSIFQKERQQGFSRIVFLLSQENRVWSAKEFLAGLAVAVPETIQSNLQEHITLFLYENAGGRTRMGFALPLTNTKTISQDLLSWESALEQSFAGFFSFQGQKDSLAVQFFRETGYKGVGIRYQTYSAQDLGLVYAVVGNTLVLTSGLESMRAAIDELQ
ncbi:MAG: hypothetical protein Q8P03_01405 [bacterium]|nr:hypothetical protein [bacterium]